MADEKKFNWVEVVRAILALLMGLLGGAGTQMFL